MPQELDKALTTMAIADDTTYEPCLISCFRRSCQMLANVVKSVLRGKFDTCTISRFLTRHPEVPTYYSLVKTHKLEPNVDLTHVDISRIKTRPIISSCGGPSDRISWLLVKILSPLLRFVAAHLVNSNEFIDEIQRCQVPDEACYASYDAISLYTNIDSRAAIRTLIDLLNRHWNEVETFGLSSIEIEALLNATLSCNVFRFDNNFFMQKRGLAMGIRIAPLLAIVYLDYIERTSLTAGILFYKRYIDDVFVIGTTPSELATTLANLNCKDVHIKFNIEEPDKEGFLSFLNTRVRICKGEKEIRWYKKEPSKNILLHSRSAHPLHMKVNVVRNLKTTSRRISTESSECDEKIKNILFENGYTTRTTGSWRPYAAPDGIALVLPFLNDSYSKQVNTIVRKSGLPVRVVFRPPPTLKDILTSSRVYEAGCDQKCCRYCRDQKKICHLRGTVYLITCSGCGKRYVGETERPLRKRLDEHRRALSHPQSYPTSSFSRHRTTMHTREPAPELEVRVLHRNLMKPLERKIMEAKEIKRCKPEINSKEELVEALKYIA
ncbi:hypothetical protein Y032_0149g2693 [Ancylostoma ceylanicum]|uniref:GIY-YIG domain-containing protein n=1 Tax=Ancylostoma ceylanicum TaxID=53326 RepID=A0A016T1M0_9BILA|nr:hypothetical protein Y032_0149g2693 [Ancylostoma ceylanicum]